MATVAAKGETKDIGARGYVAIAAVMIVTVVGLLGGIVWYNFDKTRALTIMAAERLLAETGDKTMNRLRLFYDPVIAIVALASRVPQISTVDAGGAPQRPTMMMTGLRRYPQIFSLYVGFGDGSFEMVTRVSGDARAEARKQIGAPDEAVFAHELVEVGPDGVHRASWSFLAEDGKVIDSRAAAETAYDPRQRQWYGLAHDNDEIHHTEPYLFAASQEIGITLSRRLEGPKPGVFGADLSLREASSFLAEQKVTPSSLVFLFNEQGEVVVYPDETKIRREVKDPPTSTIAPTKIADLDNPAALALFEQYKSHAEEPVWIMEAGGQPYLARVVAFTDLFDRSYLLGVLAPVQEITGDVDQIRTEALLGSVLILLLTLPVFLTIIFVWIDIRLGRKPFSIKDFMKPDFSKADVDDERL
jgi:adenylate cyclase